MSNYRRLVSIRGVIVLSMLVGMVLAAGPTSGPPALAQGSAPSPGSFWYYAGGEPVSLPLGTEAIAVRFADDLTESEKASIVDGTGDLAPGAEPREVPVPELALLALRPGLSEAGVLQVLADLRADPGIEFAYPVFEFPDARVTLTDQFVARFKDTAAAGDVAAFHRANGVRAVQAMRLPNTYLLRVAAGSDSLITANLYHESDLTVYATPDFVRFLTPSFTPDDPHYPNQWGMENTGTNPPDGVGTPDADMDASSAWNIAQGNPNVVIAIIDEGLELGHEDLDDKIVGQYTAIPGDLDANPNNTWDAHGTNCAGIAVAETDNAQGVAGMCPGCSLMAVQISYSANDGDPWTTSDSWIADGMTWAVDHGADVLSNSWGGGPPSTLIDDAISRAVNHGRAGLGSVVLFAAGNYNTTPVSYPARNNETIAVGATSPCDERKNPASCDNENWWGSHYGDDLDVVAPGVEWWTTDMMGAAGYGPGNYFDHMNGTSSATPATAGVAGLVLSHRPCLTEGKVQELIEKGAEDQVGPPGEDTLGWDEYMGWGRVNAHRTLLLADLYPCAEPEPGCHRILFDETHGWAWDGGTGDYTIEDGFSNLAGMLRAQGHIVDSLPAGATFDYTALKWYDVLVLMLPQDPYGKAEVADIARFVHEGGRLITIAEHGGFSTASRGILNDIHDYLEDGLHHNADYVHDPTDNKGGTTYWPIIHEFSPAPVNQGIGTVLEAFGSSVEVSRPAYGTAFGDDDTYVVRAVMAAAGSSGAEADTPPALEARGPFAEAQPLVPPEMQGAVSTEGLDLAPAPAAAPLGAGDVIQSWPTGLAYAWGLGYDLRTSDLWLGDIAIAGGTDLAYRFLTDGTNSGDTIDISWSGVWAADMAYNQRTGMLWQVDVDGDNCLHELDPVGQVPTGNTICSAAWPVAQRGVAYDVNTDTYYVGSWLDDTIYHISSGGTLLDSAYVGLDIAGLAYNPDTQHLFVMVNYAPNPVYVLDAADSYAVLGQFSVPGMSDYGGAGLEMDCGGNLWAVDQQTQTVYQFESGETTTCRPIVQAMSRVGAGEVFAIGDANLWDNVDWDGDGTIGLLEHDNSLLARNVFARGQVCRRPDKACYKVLFDETHGNSWSYTIGAGYGELAGLLASQGQIVHALQDPAPFDYATLRQYDVLVLVLPVEYYTAGEKAAIGRFVAGGGRLVTIGEHGGYANIEHDILNDVHDYLADGLYHNEDLVYDPTDHDVRSDWPVFHTFLPDPVTEALDAVVEYAASSVQVTGPAFGTAFGDDDTYTVASAAGATDGDGLTPDLAPAPPEGQGRLELLYEEAAPEGERNAPAREAAAAASYIYHGIRPDLYNILIYADDAYHNAPNTYLDQALQRLGLSYTAHYNGDWAGFEASLTTGGPWDLVLFGDDDISPPNSILTALDSYANAGGKLVFHGWTVGWDPGHPLWASLGFSFVSNDGDPPDPVYWWDPAHRLFTTPHSVPELTSLVGSRYGTYGQRVEPLPGFEPLAGYTPGPNPNEAALILGNEGRTVFKGFLDGQNDADLDGDAVPDGVELWVNLIDYMLPVIVQARSRVGAGDVWAVGDGGLFSDEDPDNDGTMSLYEYNNARLARNVFAFGRMCQECRVALFKDQNPWGFGARYGASSAGLAEAVYDEALLDEAGNLPAEAPAAAIGPLATGDVVNSIPSPAGGFIGLEWIDGFLWATSEFTAELYKLAPGDGTILQTIPLPTVYPCGLAWDGSTFWIPDCAADVIVQMDMAGTVLRSFPAPGSGSVGLAWDGAYLWDVDYDSDELHQIDPFTGAVVHTIPAPDTRPAGVAWDGQYLWTNGRDSMTTYQVNPADGSVMASFTTPPGTGGNNGQGAAFDGLYLWVAHFEEQTIYQVDVEHVRRWPEPNEQVLRAWGIPYDVFSSVDVGAIDLSPYCKVIVASQQPADFYKTLSINRAWFEAWIEAGGMFEFHGACQDTDDWSGLPMPGGFTKAWDPWDDVTIIDYAHPIIVGPNAVSDAEVDHWSASTHGYLVDLPRSANEIIAHEPSGEPATAEFRLGGGCVVATDQPLEWAWYFRRSAILENVIAHQECLPARVYLPLVLRNWP